MSSQQVGEQIGFYRHFLLEGIVPFWLRHGVDRQEGGLLTCMSEDGRLLSDEKYLWSQGRGIWTFAALYRRVEQRPEFLDIARRTADFLLKHGLDEKGNVVYRVGRSGGVLEGDISLYGNLFAAYGLNELAQAGGRAEDAERALDFLRRSFEEFRHPYFGRIAPYRLPDGAAWVHGPAMIGLEVANEIAAATGSPEAEAMVDWCLGRIMAAHVQPDGQTLLEHLDLEDRPVDSPEGRLIVPGHAIESMWFVLHAALRRGQGEWVPRALAVIRAMLEKGWDGVYGGCYLAVDRWSGEPVAPEVLPHAEKKIWWVHTEALYALVLASQLTEEDWCHEWYERVAQWSFAHYGDGSGEWRQRLSREGMPFTGTIALPVKDPFHLPRSVILILKTLEAGGPIYGR